MCTDWLTRSIAMPEEKPNAASFDRGVIIRDEPTLSRTVVVECLSMWVGRNKSGLEVGSHRGHLRQLT